LHLKQKIIRATYFVVGIAIGIFINQLPVAEAASKKERSGEVDLSIASILPEAIPPLHRSCYSIGYDTRNKNASWVYERLTADDLRGNVSRDHCQFKEDDRIPDIFRATLKDYKGSGFDRGHLAPAANHRNSLHEMEDTFFMSNMCPQHPKLNRGYWSKLEKHVRDLTKAYPVVHVFTGPLYLPKEEDGKRWIKYQVIGENDVAVPTHFFKVLLLEKPSGAMVCQGYVLPNEPIDSQIKIESFQTTISKIEKASGIIFQKPS
jgi:endonuclease G, mitochondrial